MSMNPIIYYIGGTALLLFAGWQWKLVRDTNKTPMQHYSVERSIGEVEIRSYPPFTKAQVEESGSYQQISYRSFQRLASYIFGGNSENRQIAMTTPVGMQYDTTGSQQASMYFVMPETSADSSLPLPNDGSVKLVACDGFRAAALRFGGVAGPEDFRKHEEKLRNILQKEGIEFVPQAEWLRYNPPFQLVNRRNEVVFRIR